MDSAALCPYRRSTAARGPDASQPAGGDPAPRCDTGANPFDVSSCFTSAPLARRSCATDDRCNVDDSADAKRAAAGKMVKVQESCSLLMSTTATRVSFDPCKRKITKST